MLYKNVTIDDDSQYFETTSKNKHSATVKSNKVLLWSDTFKCQHNTTTHMKGQKISLSGKNYLCFQTDRENSRAAQCAKSRKLTKVIDSIIEIE